MPRNRRGIALKQSVNSHLQNHISFPAYEKSMKYAIVVVSLGVLMQIVWASIRKYAKQKNPRVAIRMQKTLITSSWSVLSLRSWCYFYVPMCMRKE